MKIVGALPSSNASLLRDKLSDFHDENVQVVMRLPPAFRIWLLSLLGCMAATALSFPHIDTAIAQYLYPVSRHVKFLENKLGSTVLLSIEFMAITILMFLRLTYRKLSRFERTISLACVTSIFAYTINSTIFKCSFGVPNPDQVMHGAQHTFNWLSGSEKSSFPSGHMVLASAFAGVFMRHFRSSIWPLSGFLVAAAATLLVGDWHFLSDLFAGTFIGLSVGLAAGRYLLPVSSEATSSIEVVGDGGDYP